MTARIEPTAPALPRHRADQRVTQVGVLRSEWAKLRSLASTVWSLLTAVVLIVGFGALYAMVRVTRPPQQPAAVASFDPVAVSLTGIHLAQVAVGVLGVLLITGEYATGMVRVSFAAVPRRLPVLWGKAITFALTTLALCVPATFAAFLVGQSILSSAHLDTTLDHPGAVRAVLGSALYLTAVGLLGLGLGAVLRNTAGAISTLFGVLFALQIVVGFLPETITDQVGKYLPGPAGAAVTSVRPDPTSLGPWTGFGLFCLYTAIVLGLAAWRLRRRDA
ncbi:MAG: ABC transporter permease [Sporichthyaceae bacterium]|nr:ABC transporter permease [Sporichthyaceae bacterium]